MGNYAIIVVGYNRVRELERLLCSINSADFEGDSVPLIISLDNCGSRDIYNAANDFQWKHGKKTVRLCSERMGLRKHILSCGDYLQEYDAIAVLEDDLLVAPDFYRYMKQTVKFYENDDRIAGISLYSHLWNVNVSYPFQPMKTENDIYFMQFAQSWGQIWMKKQWLAFKEWYVKNDVDFDCVKGVPDFVCRWRNNSWLKYHIRYCVENDKYFVYPYDSLTTCFSEKGEHAKYKTTTYQVPLFSGKRELYKLEKLTEQAVCYDAFFERISLGDIGIIKKEDICVDLYASKQKELYKRYVLSTKKMDYKVVKSFALEMRPMELNVLMQIDGDEIYLYDTQQKGDKVRGKIAQEIAVWHYHAKAFVKKKIICLAFVQYVICKLIRRH